MNSKTEATVLEVANEVYAELRGGHDESVYQQAMAYEFRLRRISNPHHPRTFTSTMTAMSPAEADTNPVTDGKSMRRQAGRGCSMRYDMLVT